jgi:hypothetical protein
VCGCLFESLQREVLGTDGHLVVPMFGLAVAVLRKRINTVAMNKKSDLSDVFITLNTDTVFTEKMSSIDWKLSNLNCDYEHKMR